MKKIKYCLFAVLFTMLALPASTQVRAEEPAKDSTVVMKAMVEEGIDYDIYVYMQYEDDQDNGYSWTLSNATGYEMMDSIPAGMYVPDAMFAGNYGGAKYWTYVDPTPIETAPGEPTYINIVAGTKEFVQKYKALAYDVDEACGAIESGSISEKEANKKLNKMGTKALEYTTESDVSNPTVFVDEKETEESGYDAMFYIKIAGALAILAFLFFIMRHRNKKNMEEEK